MNQQLQEQRWQLLPPQQQQQARDVIAWMLDSIKVSIAFERDLEAAEQRRLAEEQKAPGAARRRA